MIFIAIAALVCLVDLGFKELIQGVKREEFPIEVKKSKGKFFLYQNYNYGFPFGWLKQYPEVVRYLPLMVLSALAGAFLWVLPKKGLAYEKLSLAFAIGGGLSNLYDRLKRNYVVDYLNVRWRFLKKVVFNLGDVFILVGVLMMLVKEFSHSIKVK